MAHAFLLVLPFCAVLKVGVLGNFDANLGLLPFLALAPVLMLNGSLRRVVMRRGSEGRVLRVLALTFLVASAMTIVHGMQLASIGAEAYGLDPVRKAVVTSVVPIFLVVLTATGAAIGHQMNPVDLQRGIDTALWLTVGYTILQLSWLVFDNPLYGALWPVLEGGRGPADVPYLQHFGRINGPTLEPAEFVKLLLLLFLPWVAFPAVGEPSGKRMVVVLTLALATLSIVGLLLVPVAIAMLALARKANSRSRLLSLGLAVGYPIGAWCSLRVS